MRLSHKMFSSPKCIILLCITSSNILLYFVVLVFGYYMFIDGFEYFVTH